MHVTVIVVLVLIAIILSGGTLAYVTGLAGVPTRVEELSSTTAKLVAAEKELAGALVDLSKAVGAYGERIKAIEERITKVEEAVKPKPPIKIGVTSGITGAYAFQTKEIMQAIGLWMDYINAKGGLLGRPVEFVIYDDMSKPEVTMSLYEKLITVDKVDIVIGPYGSPCAMTATIVAEKYHMPTLCRGGSAEIYTRGLKYTFAVGTVEIEKSSLGYAFSRLLSMATPKPETIAIISEATTFHKGTANETIRYCKEAGFKVVHYEEYKPGITDMSPIITKLKAVNPDVVVVSAYFTEQTLFVRQSKELGFNAKLFFHTAAGPNLDDWMKTLGKDGDYAIGGTMFDPSFSPEYCRGILDFVTRFEARYGYKPGHYAGVEWGILQVLEEAVTKAGTTEREKLRDTIEALNTSCVIGSVKFDENRIAQRPYPLCQIQNGKRVIVWPPEAATAKLVYPVPTWKERG